MHSRKILSIVAILIVTLVAVYGLKRSALPRDKDEEPKKLRGIGTSEGASTNADGAVSSKTAATPEAPASERTGTSRNEAGTERLQESFRAAREAFQEQKDALANATAEELHHSPAQTLEAARRLAEIVELQSRHPEQTARFLDFYLDCARDDRATTVIRAQCLDRYMKLSNMNADAQEKLIRDFPEDIVYLFKALQ